MVNNKVQISAPCRADDISAYIDGELSPEEEFGLTVHLSECRECTAELNRQKSFLNLVGAGLSEGLAPEMPRDFAKIVTATAESSVNGVRGRREIFIASAAILIIAAGSLLLLGSGTSLGSGIIEKAVAVASAAGHAMYSLALGIAIMIKAVAGGAGSFAALMAVAVVGTGAAFILVRNFRRPARSRETLQP